MVLEDFISLEEQSPEHTGDLAWTIKGPFPAPSNCPVYCPEPGVPRGIPMTKINSHLISASHLIWSTSSLPAPFPVGLRQHCVRTGAHGWLSQLTI